MKYISSISVDISSNDVETNPVVNEKIERELQVEFSKLGVKSTISNVTGDDIVISSFLSEDKIELVNKIVFKLLHKHAEGFEDLNGVSNTPEDAGEGVSYAIAKTNSEYGDSIIVSFDTYCGESFVNNAALFVEEIGQKFGYDTSTSVSKYPKEIPGIGYSGATTDDPVVIITLKNVNDLSKIAGLIYGGLLGFENVYFVEKGSPTNILPPGVIYTMSAFLNGNSIDLYPGIKRKNYLP
ncbi:conserved hypothetical protein [Methanococcus vannielii SB]|jgi:hypothetical protein|uniref:Uncharacterized protein n=1 Tax=Methanococcus vannielii (strain ATCC 35089 / DSM 1224 / JCM 13029 / OCM 148 / SB) TaxID=406327 RepID=A6URQ4_METVS|nr:hypothetical protein [Methanococcus vannielii]ABR55176.1 conserved hypothetical protein [Methanococcus vannielii SB]